MIKQGKDIIICRCEEVTEKEILEAISNGATSLDDIKRRTMAGMGLCQGRTCRRLLAQILANMLNKKLKDILPLPYRPPIRPVKLGELAVDYMDLKDKKRELEKNSPGNLSKQCKKERR